MKGKNYFTDFEICILSGIAIYLWPIIPTGNIKYYGEKILLDNKSSKLLIQFKKFKVLCAGSTHNTEEILISKLHKHCIKI